MAWNLYSAPISQIDKNVYRFFQFQTYSVLTSFQTQHFLLHEGINGVIYKEKRAANWATWPLSQLFHEEQEIPHVYIQKLTPLFNVRVSMKSYPFLSKYGPFLTCIFLCFTLLKTGQEEAALDKSLWVADLTESDLLKIIISFFTPDSVKSCKQHLNITLSLLTNNCQFLLIPIL